jgi:hypothetical protein
MQIHQWMARHLGQTIAKGRAMLPRTVACDDCGKKALVRAYGRVEYDWEQDGPDGQIATQPVISSVRLTIDCPHCGVKTQDFHPAANTHLT